MSLDSVESKERSLLSLLLKLVVIPDHAVEQLKDLRLNRAEHDAIMGALLAWRPSMNYDYQLFREELDQGLAEYADGLKAEGAPLPDDEKLTLAIDLHIARIRHARLDVQYRRAAKLLEDMAPEDRPSALGTVADLMDEWLSVHQSLEQLSVKTGQSHRV
jgi:hypothetical protein